MSRPPPDIAHAAAAHTAAGASAGPPASAAALPGPADDLADGFAAQVRRWAADAGAPAADLDAVQAAARAVSLATSDGHACVPLAAVAPERWSAARLRAALLGCGVAGDAAPGAPVRPLLVDADDRLYLRRYWDYEGRLAQALMRRARPIDDAPLPEAVRALVDHSFAANAQRLGQRPDWQKLAVALALRRRLTIVSGGPGTGKTTTVVALLAALLQARPTARIALAAPTGKAAARLLEAIRLRARQVVPEALHDRLPTESFTVHRLIGLGGGDAPPRHHAGNPLALDVLVVDEASMLDLALATRLLEALADDTRLVLLGDKDQLAAVEAGAVFAELCADPSLDAATRARLAQDTGTPEARIVTPAPARATPLAGAVVWFSESHRFRSDSGIGRLAADVVAGRGSAALDWIAGSADPSVRWIDDDGVEPGTSTRDELLDGFGDYIATLRAGATDPADLFQAFDRFRVLCALRGGPRGVAGINRWLGERLRRDVDHPLDPGPGSPWYPGRPVIVLRNDPVLRLFNGDIGLVLPGAGVPMVAFPDQDGGFRSVPALRLPEHDTAFAITVHKAQGSEFARVLLLLPRDASRVATRELVYTGITRAAARFTVVASRVAFVAACGTPTERRGGLLARLLAVPPIADRRLNDGPLPAPA